METQMGKKLLTAEEAALFLKISIQTLYNMKHKGLLRGFNMGGKKRGKLYFLEADLMTLVVGKAV
ncbi:MAG: helix-turn-helix domain-containing protein [Bdellovibrionales bacterium]|nr:helix-turn-helix domain-containing protein [Bdellovibrionales bacterium]